MHPSADDMREYLTGTAALAASADTNDPRHAEYHSMINDVLDQMDREGGPSHGQR